MPLDRNEMDFPAACEMVLGREANSQKIYDFASAHDGFACDLGQAPALIVPQIDGCSHASLPEFIEARPLSGQDARGKLTACNPSFAPQKPDGNFSTAVRLMPEMQSPEAVSAFQIRMTDISLRVPLGALYVTGGSEFFCFQYDDSISFRKRLTDIASSLPTGSNISHYNGPVCDALLLSR